MARAQETSNKKEVRNKQEKKRKDKEKKRLEKKANGKVNTFDDMIAYVDENGKITSTPPELRKKSEIDINDIQIGVPKREDQDKKNPNRRGIVTFFNESKGFGFIKDLDNQQSIFVHANGLLDKIRENNRVTFLIENGSRGPMATNVKLTD